MNRKIIAILRGVKPDTVESITEILLDAGINQIEVPLNSPEPFDSISLIAKRFKGAGLFGAGTVLTVAEVDRLANIGADLVISPNCDLSVIKQTKQRGLLSYPGVMTPTECFAALGAGADGLKFFPGNLIGPEGMKALHAVLPKETNCYAVGGVDEHNIGEWVAAGASGFGIGSGLYKAGDSAEAVGRKARDLVAAYDAAKGH